LNRPRRAATRRRVLSGSLLRLIERREGEERREAGTRIHVTPWLGEFLESLGSKLKKRRKKEKKFPVGKKEVLI